VRWIKDLGLNHGMAGCFIMPDKEIHLDASMDEADVAETLIHECIHAVSAVSALRLSEQKVRPLGFGLHSMLAPFLKKI
jgi:hypothetical protein